MQWWRNISLRKRAVLWFVVAAAFLAAIVAAWIRGWPVVNWLAGVGFAGSLIFGLLNLLDNAVINDLDKAYEPPP